MTDQRRVENQSPNTVNYNDWLIAAAKRRHAVEDLPATIVEAVRLAKMDKRHNQLNKLILERPAIERKCP